MADEKTEATDAKPELGELLKEWDESVPGKRAAEAKAEDEREGLPAESLQEDADTDKFGDRLSPYVDRLRELEQDRGRLSGDLTAARAYEARHHEIVDKFDFERLVERIEGETALDRDSIASRLKLKLAEDPEFLEAAEARYENDTFKNLTDELIEELAESHPKVARGSLHAAVLAARASLHGSSVVPGEYGDFSRMTNAEFLEAKERVFADAKSGRLKASRGRGGFFSSNP